MRQITHITTRGEWEAAQPLGEYRTPSLETENFIHCSTPAQVIEVANAFYKGIPDLVMLYIDEAACTAAVKWEAPAHPEIHDHTPADNQLFPHIYGPLNVNAVTKVVPLTADGDGVFRTVPA